MARRSFLTRTEGSRLAGAAIADVRRSRHSTGSGRTHPLSPNARSTAARRWLIVVALFTVTFALSNPFAAFGVFLPVLSEAFGWSRGAISVAYSIHLLIGGVLGLFVGAVADRHGPRVPLAVTVMIGGLGHVLAGTVTALWQFYLFVGLLGGIGTSGFYVLGTSTVARWFPDRRGLALGIVLTGFNLGFITGGPGAAFLIERLGWRLAYFVLGGALALVGTVAALTVRFPAADRLARPWPSGESTGAASRPHASMPGTGLGRALGDARLWSLAVSSLMSGFVLLMVSVHIVSYARDQGVELAGASLTLTAYGLGAIAGRLGGGAAADRFGGPLSGMVSCVVLQLAACLLLLVQPSELTLLVVLVTFGIGFGAGDTVFTKAIPEVFGVRALGAIMGVVALGWRCGAALGPSVAGFLRDVSGSYLVAFGLAPAAVVGSLVLFAVGVRRRRAA